MKKIYFVFIMALLIGTTLQGCEAGNEIADRSCPPEASDAHAPEIKITEEMAYESVYHYFLGGMIGTQRRRILTVCL